MVSGASHTRADEGGSASGQIRFGLPASGVRWVLGVLGAAFAAVATPARAQDCADGPYTLDQMVEDLTAVETFLRNDDSELAGKAGEKLEDGLPCLHDVLPRMIVGRVLRAVGAGLVVSGDDATGEDWMRTAAEIEQAFDYGLEDLPEVHPVRDVYANAKSTAGGEEVAVAGAALAAGTVYLDGRKVLEAKARLDRWHLLQHDDGTTVRSWVMEGNRFPDAVLVSSAPVVATKKGKTPKPAPVPVPTAPKPVPVASAPTPKPPRPQPVAPNPANGSVIVQRDRPWEKTPLMIGGGAILAAGAGVYYASFLSHQKFVNANDDDVLVDLQSKTNRLVIASLAIVGVGTGTLTWGVILDGDSGPLPALRVRF